MERQLSTEVSIYESELIFRDKQPIKVSIDSDKEQTTTDYFKDKGDEKGSTMSTYESNINSQKPNLLMTTPKQVSKSKDDTSESKGHSYRKITEFGDGSRLIIEKRANQDDKLVVNSFYQDSAQRMLETSTRVPSNDVNTINVYNESISSHTEDQEDSQQNEMADNTGVQTTSYGKGDSI